VVADCLTPLLNSRRWVTRRVDRVEFLDLMTVRRTIALTCDLDRLACFPGGGGDPTTGEFLVPLGWFVPWANAGAVLVDADGRTIPYLTSRESDDKVEEMLLERLRALDLDDCDAHLRAVPAHRRDPGRPGDRCDGCKRAGCSDGHRDLMVEKWGCRTVLVLLAALHARDPCRDVPETTPAKELARLVMAWQRNFVAFARLDASAMQRGQVTLQLSYDEELLDWEPPWEHRRRLVHEIEGARCERPFECRAYVSRGGPFAPDLDALAPRGPLGLLAGSGSPRMRKLGRRGPLHVAWHVAWHQAGGIDVPDHHVDVVLPTELAVVRMRMLRMFDGRRCATVADQAGSHATIVAPEPRELPEEDADCAWSPTLFSVVLAQRSPSGWYGGALMAALTAIALLLVAICWLPAIVQNVDAGVAALLLAPTLVSAALSVRAGSEIAEQLTTTLRGLIGAVSVLAATCAVALVVHPGQPEPNALQRVLGRNPPIHHLGLLRGVWIGAAVLLVAIAAALLAGGWRIKRLLAYARRPAPRYLSDLDFGRVLNPRDPQRPKRHLPRIGPPDCWLNVDEGDLVTWGWLNDAASFAKQPGSDANFWLGHERKRDKLIGWVRRIVRYEPPSPPVPPSSPPCPQCRCC